MSFHMTTWLVRDWYVIGYLPLWPANAASWRAYVPELLFIAKLPPLLFNKPSPLMSPIEARQCATLRWLVHKPCQFLFFWKLFQFSKQTCEMTTDDLSCSRNIWKTLLEISPNYLMSLSSLWLGSAPAFSNTSTQELWLEAAAYIRGVRPVRD